MPAVCLPESRWSPNVSSRGRKPETFPLNAHFGYVVWQHRVAHGWSQEEFAFRAGLNRSYGGEIERGSANPSLATVVKIAEAFGLAPSALVGEVEARCRA